MLISSAMFSDFELEMIELSPVFGYVFQVNEGEEGSGSHGRDRVQGCKGCRLALSHLSPRCSR